MNLENPIYRNEENSQRLNGQLTAVLGVMALSGAEALPASASIEGLKNGLLVGGLFLIPKGLAAIMQASRRLQLLDYAEAWDQNDNLETDENY